MSELLEYKGYVGNIEFSPEDNIFHGKVQGIRSLISYEGSTGDELVADFHNAVDDYLELCEQRRSTLNSLAENTRQSYLAVNQ